VTITSKVRNDLALPQKTQRTPRDVGSSASCAVNCGTRFKQFQSFLIWTVVCLAGAATASPAEPPATVAPRIAISDEPEGAAVRLLDDAGTLPIPVAARVVLSTATLDPVLDARLAAFEKRRTAVWLALPGPAAQEDVERWRAALRGLLERHGTLLTILEVTFDRQPARLASFALQIAATEVRASHETIRIALGGAATVDRARLEELYTSQLAPYVDLLAVDEGTLRVDPAIVDWLHGVDPLAAIVLTASGPSGAGDEPARRVVDGVFQDLGTDVVMHAWRAADVTPAALRTLGPLADLLAHDVSILDPEGVGLTLLRGAEDVTKSLRTRLLFDDRTFSTYLVYWGDASPDPLRMSLVLPVEGVPGVHDLLGGAKSTAAGYTRDQATGRVRADTPLTGRPMVVDFNEGAAEVMAERSGVSAERPIPIEEIIARHQQQQRAQDMLVRTYIAHARMQQHFRPTVTDPGYDVMTENRYFVAGGDVEWEELSFSVNGSKWGADRPAFPLLQPEKVLSLPLQLRFDEGYRYRLAGSERVDQYDCFVVRFEPVRRDSALYQGTVWIDKKTFARIRVQAVQGGLSAPVVSNEETQQYSAVVIGNRPVFLFSGLSARQIVLIAGRNLLVEKAVTFTGFRVNDPEFDRERASARESERVMYRETDRGLRYYVKENGKRVVSDRATNHAKAMAMGVTLDPSYAFPLPIFGIDYLNFQFGSPDTQLAVLFAGVLAAGNIQRSKIGDTRLDASVDFFAIAAPSSDRIYETGGEAEAERVLTWPLSTGLNLGWQATPFQKATLQYQSRFDGYVHDRTTAENYVVPSSTLTQGIGGAWEYRRAGYSLLLNGTWFGRATWRAWGFREPGSAAPSTTSPRTYVKYTAGLSRDFYINPFQKLHLNGAWFGGRDLDRFAKYQFGLFDDTRIHGVPASGVRYGELAMARGSYSLNIFEQYRLDLFLDQAWGRDDPGRRTWQPISGFGIAVNVRAPWNTIFRADLGKSLLPDRFGGLGSTTLQILFLKPLR
jgi:hypothetical protein